jgi:hypothetical protein
VAVVAMAEAQALVPVARAVVPVARRPLREMVRLPGLMLAAAAAAAVALFRYLRAAGWV